MSRVLIAGCGYVGQATAEIFREANWEVDAWTASPASAARLLTAGYTARVVDLPDRDAVAEAAADCDVIIQSASSAGGGVEAYRRVYLQGARNLASVFPDSLLLFTSSTSVYGQVGGEWVTEESAAHPNRETGRILRETEELVLVAGGIVARLAGIYGPGRSALLRKFLAGTAVLDPSSERFTNQIHRDDIASALLLLAQTFLATRPTEVSPSRRIYNVSDNHPISQRECYAWLANQLGRPLPPEVAATSERKRGNSNKRVSSEKLQAFGWRPRYPTFAAAMTASILPALKQQPPV